MLVRTARAGSIRRAHTTSASVSGLIRMGTEPRSISIGPSPGGRLMPYRPQARRASLQAPSAVAAMPMFQMAALSDGFRRTASALQRYDSGQLARYLYVRPMLYQGTLHRGAARIA